MLNLLSPACISSSYSSAAEVVAVICTGGVCQCTVQVPQRCGKCTLAARGVVILSTTQHNTRIQNMPGPMYSRLRLTKMILIRSRIKSK